MARETNLYDVLGIAPSSTDAEIKKAYRLLALKNHPDKNNHSKESTEKFQEITQAYHILSNPGQRQIYDRFGTEGLNGKAEIDPNIHFNANSLFDHFFGESFMSFNHFTHGRSSRQKQQRRGPDINHQLACTLEDLYTGKKTKLGLRRTELCSACNAQGGVNIQRCFDCMGTGRIVMRSQHGHITRTVEQPCYSCNQQGTYFMPNDICKRCNGNKVVEERRILTVDIEPGAKNGDPIILVGEGDQGIGIVPGNVVVTIVQKNHPFFTRNGNNLVCDVKIDLLTALSGGAFNIKHLSGSYLNVNIAKGEIIRPNSYKLIKGYGMPISRGIFGDLIIRFSITFPEKLPDNCYSLLSQVLPKQEKPIEVPTDAVQIPVVLTDCPIQDGQNFNGDQLYENNGEQPNKRRKDSNGRYSPPGESDVQCTSQ